MLYPGNTLSQYVLKDAVWALESALHFDALRRRQLCLRLDAGFGTDDNLNWILHQGYQLVAKSNSGRRAGTWGQQVAGWQVVEDGHRWVALPKDQLKFCVPTRTIAIRWLDHHRDRLKHALYVVTDFERSLLELCQFYDLRGGFEVDIRDDKQGLLITHRRKRSQCAQEVLLLLTDLAHNFLSMFRSEILAGTPLAELGPYRLIQNVLTTPRRAIIADGHLVELQLSETHPSSSVLVDVLPRLWQ